MLVISPAFYPATFYGGPIYSIYEFTKTLKKTSADVRVISTNANGKENLEIKTGDWQKLDDVLPVKYYKSLDSRGTSLSMLWNLRREIKKADIVYLVSIFSAPTPLTILFCRLLKKPLIISPRGQLGKWCLEQGNPFKKLWLRLFVGSNNQSSNQPFFWHLTSEKEKQDVLSVCPSAKTFVIPNGVSEELFKLNDKPKNRSYYNKYTGFDCLDKKIIISMGRLQKVKGFDLLIEAIGMIDRPDMVLLIAGEDFGEKQNLDWMIGNLGLREKVFLIGRIEGTEKIKFLRNADLFALASHHENFGMVYAEALAAGTPVIASTNTPWQEVEKNNCGKWVENTPEKFAGTITELLSVNLNQIGLNAVNYIKENFNEAIIANKFMKVLKKLTMDKDDSK